MAKKPIKITETVLRDAHQSLLATRMPLSDMLPILGEMDKVGYYSAEVWGYSEGSSVSAAAENTAVPTARAAIRTNEIHFFIIPSSYFAE